MIATGYYDSFILLAVLRITQGAISSGFNPLSFSLLAEYFPPDKRATANSLLQSGNFIGWGVSSLSIMAISLYGWRATYGIIGAIAMVVALLTIALVKEPIKKVTETLEKNKKDNEKAQ